MTATFWTARRKNTEFASSTLFLRERSRSAKSAACDWLRRGGTVMINGDDAARVAESLRCMLDMPDGLRIRMIGTEIIVYVEPGA